MTTAQLDNGIQYLKDMTKKLGTHPGHIIAKANAMTDALAKNYNFSLFEADFFINLLLSNQLISYDAPFIKLTEKGYAYLNEDQRPYLQLQLANCLHIGKDQTRNFYNLWDIIGNDKDHNPFYAASSTYYNTVKRYIPGLPPTYSQYIQDRNNQGQSSTRSEWCKDHFLAIPDQEIEPFLASLSQQINAAHAQQADTAVNATIPQLSKMADEATTAPADTYPIAVNNPPMAPTKTPKIFITHNTKDADYAKALVQMLINIGVSENDIFCSSLPGFGVQFGKDFIDVIREQFDRHELIMLYIHSPRYYQSHVSLCEMGASWVLQQEHRSFLTQDCEFRMLDAVIPSTETAFKAGDPNTYHLLDDFVGFIEAKFALPPKPIIRWNQIRQDFISTVTP